MTDNARRHAAKKRAQGQRLEERARQADDPIVKVALRRRAAECFADADRLLAVSNAAQRRRRERKETP